MRPRNEQPVRTLILRHLEGRESSVYDLEMVIGVNRRNLREYMEMLHAEKAIHVDHWVCHGRGPKVPVWALGEGPDEPYPRRRTPAEQQRLNRSRVTWLKIAR